MPLVDLGIFNLGQDIQTQEDFRDQKSTSICCRAKAEIVRRHCLANNLNG